MILHSAATGAALILIYDISSKTANYIGDRDIVYKRERSLSKAKEDPNKHRSYDTKPYRKAVLVFYRKPWVLGLFCGRFRALQPEKPRHEDLDADEDQDRAAEDIGAPRL